MEVVLRRLANNVCMKTAVSSNDVSRRLSDLKLLPKCIYIFSSISLCTCQNVLWTGSYKWAWFCLRENRGIVNNTRICDLS